VSRIVKRGEKRKPMTFRVSARIDAPRPAFQKVVDRLLRDYVKYRGNIIGKTLRAPAGTTGRQMTLALRRVRDLYDMKGIRA
jgi:hypothetical protein